jgi:ketosteroid isomerase-like protein
MARLQLGHLLACVLLSACAVQQENGEAVLNDKVFGMSLDYDLRPASLADTRRVMNAFTTAYVAGDRAGLVSVLSDDFVWYVHDGTVIPRGEAHRGVDGLLSVLNQRADDWSEVIYSDIEFHASGNKVFQQFRVRGLDNKKGAFDSYGIDIYIIRDGKIASKDSYWKRQTGS